MKRLLLLLPLLGGCTYYFDTGLDRQLSRRVEERLKNDEGLPLEQFSLTPPVSVEQALPKFKEGRPQSGRTLPPEKPVLSGAEGPVLGGAEEVARSEAKVPDTPPVLKARSDARKPLSLDPIDRQKKENNRQTELTTPPIPSKAEGPKAPPESTQQLSIAQARTLALENNLDLKIAQVDPKLAATAVSQEQAKFDDLIFARAKYSRKQLPPDITEIDTLVPTDPTSPSKGTTVLRVDSEQLKQFLDIDAGISIPLRTGGKITLSVPFDEKSVAKKGFEQGQYSAALRFSISQPLLRGGGIDNNVAGIRIAQYEQQAVDVKTRLQSIRVLAAVERAYWGVYVAWGELDVRLQQYENAADNLAMVKKRVAAGLTAAVEINRAEIGVAESGWKG
jgi:outer membrane protein